MKSILCLLLVLISEALAVSIEIINETHFKCQNTTYAIGSTSPLKMDQLIISTEKTEDRNLFIGKTTGLNLMLEKVEYVSKLTVGGYLDQKSIQLVGNLTCLEGLIFLEDETKFEQVVSFKPLENLTGLSILCFKKTGFANEYWSGQPETLKIQSLLQIIGNFRSLNILDLSENILFPPRENDSVYSQWRATKIEECARLLAKEFRGKTLIMKDTKLGELFISNYGHNFSKGSGYDLTLDFSENYIPLESAVKFIEEIRGERIEVDFSNTLLTKKVRSQRNKRYKDTVVNAYTVDDIRRELVERYLGDTSLRCRDGKSAHMF